ncbi:uncharacterized protein METZ01_LOCUS494674, partial [marine metagenome]
MKKVDKAAVKKLEQQKNDALRRIAERLKNQAEAPAEGHAHHTAHISGPAAEAWAETRAKAKAEAAAEAEIAANLAAAKEEGPCEQFHENGQLWRRFNYKDGEVDGLSE